MILAAFAVAMCNIARDNRAKEASADEINLLEDAIADAEPIDKNTASGEPLYKTHRDMDMPLIQIDGTYYIGLLEIPVLSLKLPVRGELDYAALNYSPCRYTGSVYKDDMIIAGHNFYSHFGSLSMLQIGDEVRFTDSDGNLFVYGVSDIQQIDGTDTDGMQSGDWDMTLFTCTLSGLKRVTVRLVKI